MPELPEVETTRRGLAPWMEGSRFGTPLLRRAGLRFPFSPGFGARLEGRTVERLDRRAKHLLAVLDDDSVLSMHLGMTGRFRRRVPGVAEKGDVPAEAHDHVVLPMTGPDGGAFEIVYNDPRRFGWMEIVDPDGLASHPRLGRLGVEPLGPDMDASIVAPLLAVRSSPVKTVLLDQRVVAGLGNIYVCEALWRARTSPTVPASSLVGADGTPLPVLRDLVGRIREVLEESIAKGGSTLRDYRAADGTRGSFQDGFAVYGCEGRPCPRPGCGGTVARFEQAGRSTFHCGACQTEPGRLAESPVRPMPVPKGDSGPWRDGSGGARRR